MQVRGCNEHETAEEETKGSLLECVLAMMEIARRMRCMRAHPASPKAPAVFAVVDEFVRCLVVAFVA